MNLMIWSLKDRKHLVTCQPPIDLIICDEGHRLKSKDNKTTKMFEALRTQRRISKYAPGGLWRCIPLTNSPLRHTRPE